MSLPNLALASWPLRLLLSILRIDRFILGDRLTLFLSDYYISSLNVCTLDKCWVLSWNLTLGRVEADLAVTRDFGRW